MPVIQKMPPYMVLAPRLPARLSVLVVAFVASACLYEDIADTCRAVGECASGYRCNIDTNLCEADAPDGGVDAAPDARLAMDAPGDAPAPTLDSGADASTDAAGSCGINADCREPGLAFCHLGRCVACVTSAACLSETAPICEGNVCVGCSAAATKCAEATANARPVCEEPTGKCVECLRDESCGPARPICSPERTCVPCANDGQCAGKGPGVCLEDGRCASDAETIFATYTTPRCSGSPTQDGTVANPFCEAQAAINAVTMNKRLVVLRGDLDRIRVENADGPITLVGKEGASIIPGGAPGILLVKGELAVRNLSIKSGTRVGVEARAGTTLRMDECTVTGNAGGGILLDGANFDIRRTKVAQNKQGQLGAALFGGILVNNSGEVTPRRLERVSILDNEGPSLTCVQAITAQDTYVAPSAPAASCAVTSCPAPSATCGAP